jgi:hypothetical protein
MTQAFSKMMSATEGRFLTVVEAEKSLCSALELPHRMLISKMLQQSEFEIVDYATHAFCDITPGFDGPAGSLRRKKGHQDGRIILRYAAQAIREGSTEILFEKVLSWLVGHLDGGNVTGEHMEVFFHFIQQGARRELPAHAHPFIDQVFEEIISCVRQASWSATIHKAHRRIAEFAVERVMNIMPDVKAKYGVSSVPKCKRDIELLVKELARVMKSPSPYEMQRQFSSWLIERLVNQVEYSSDVWFWTLMAVREGIVSCCGPKSADAINDMFESMVDNIGSIMDAVKLSSAAGEIADKVAERLVERGETLGLLRVDEFQTAVSMVNRQLISELAVLHACGNADAQVEPLANLWCTVVLAQMPSTKAGLLATNIKVLLDVVHEQFGETMGKTFKTWILQLVDVARRCEATARLSEIVDAASVEAADWAIENLSPFAADKRASYRDVRLVLAKILSLIPSGPSGVNGEEFRRYITRFLLPNLPFNVTLLTQVYDRVIRVIESHAQPEDARLVRGYIDDAMGCFERQSKLRNIASEADKLVIGAVERGYQGAPRHESLQRHGIAAGRRDGRFLLEKVVETAIVGGTNAECALHQYFNYEIVRLSRLPGRVVMEFLRGMLEHLREYPEVHELLMGLAQAAPAYTAAAKITVSSDEWASHISLHSVNSAPAYREQIGATGLEACNRDNAVMLRGLARHLVLSPADASDFKLWWKRRIGKNIRTKPETFDANGSWERVNFNAAVEVLRGQLDPEEADVVEAYLNQMFGARQPGKESNQPVGSKRTTRPIPMVGSQVIMSFSDIGM